jgi:hypothetical protein
LDRDERELQRQLRALRQADEEAAPLFAHVWARARAQARPPARWRRAGFRVVMPAACVLAALFVWWQREPPGSPLPSHPPQLVSPWETPLDFLLETPGSEFLVSVPRIEASLEFDSGALDVHLERSEP